MKRKSAQRLNLEQIQLNMDVRRKLRLADRFETLYDAGQWWVRALTRKPRVWLAIQCRDGFDFSEINLKVKEHDHGEVA